ncbi:MAG TPA: dihydrofolate reductase family protein [Arachidicoccus sp.]|nr:dihydrofolate reductase family protein [Arachidicoccus sp.]
MKVILVFVSSLDGKVTKWGRSKVSAWSSPEDGAYFLKIRNESALIVMGSQTFEAELNQNTFHPNKGQKVVVMTKRVHEFQNDHHQDITSGHLEFTDLSPQDLHKQFLEAGSSTLFLLGGPHIATSFFKAALIDEVWLTIEPKVFGLGNNFAMEERLDIDLRLTSLEKVNDRGTLLTKYEVIKN